MSLITAINLEKYYGADLIFSRVSFTLVHASRIGLVGPNGEGKTTLLKLVLGELEPNGGTIEIARHTRLGYLPQVAPDLGDVAVWDYVSGVFAHLHQIELQLAELSRQLAQPACPPAVLARYEQLQHEFEHQDGYTCEARTHMVLNGLGFAPEQHRQPLSELSGGWRTRACLARLLLAEPDVLLLDEPTNHLDVNTTRWLENFLRDWKRGLLVVSHDRFLLDQLANHIWELAGGALERYRGNYSAYVTQRQHRYEERRRTYESQQEFIAETEDFIRRNIAGQRSKEAQGRRTRLARFIKEEAIPRPRAPQRIHLRFAPVDRCSDHVLQTAGLAVGYDGKAIQRLPDLEVRRGVRLGVVGGNGTGKTTFLRTVLGELPPVAGSFRLGAGVELGYLSQLHDPLAPSLTLLDAIRDAQTTQSEQAARNLLGSLLFSGNDVFKPVAALSGGERSRLALARLALRGANVLLLDEPTNHLDVPSQEVLQEILLEFPGTIIFVSHDRYLVEKLATQLLVLEPDEAKLVHGTWEDYLRRQQEARAAAVGAGSPGAPATRRGEHREERRRQNAQKRRLARHAALEQEIHAAEAEKRGIEEAIGLAGQQQNLERLAALTRQLQDVDGRLAAHWEEYAAVSAALEDPAAAD